MFILGGIEGQKAFGIAPMTAECRHGGYPKPIKI